MKTTLLILIASLFTATAQASSYSHECTDLRTGYTYLPDDQKLLNSHGEAYDNTDFEVRKIRIIKADSGECKDPEGNVYHWEYEQYEIGITYTHGDNQGGPSRMICDFAADGVPAGVECE